MPANLENSALSTGLKRSVFIPIPKKGNAKECSNYRTIVLISHASKVMLKILQARLQQYVNHELLDIQAGFRKGRETISQIANIRWIMEKAREFQKNIYFCFIVVSPRGSAESIASVFYVYFLIYIRFLKTYRHCQVLNFSI